MIKLIASDLDGTLLRNGAQTLNPEIFNLIRTLQSKGIAFVSASGRQLASQRSLFQPIADEISYITENGAVCVYKNEIIATFETPRSLAFRILDSIKEYLDIKAVVSGINTSYIKSGDDQFAYHVRHVLNNSTIVVDDFSDIQEPIVKIAFWDHSGGCTYEHYFKEKFKSEINVMTSGNDWIDFMPYGTNKGAALRIIMEKFGIQPEEVIAFGDQENDLEMLNLAGTSYAMASAKDEVKKHATAVTDSVERVLKQLLETL